MSLSSSASAVEFVDRFNAAYEAKHLSFETQFWGTKMALASTDSQSYSSELLSRTKKEMEDLLSDPAILTQAESYAEELISSSNTTNVIIRTCKCNDMSSSPEAKKIREETSELESELEMARNNMTLGYKDPVGDREFTEASSVGLRNVQRTSPDEATRKAAYEGLRSIGPFVLSKGFVDIVKKRNQLAKSLGFVDYYDYTVTNAEGFGKDRLFEILDGLEEGTRPLLVKARAEFQSRFGADALEPWNVGYKMAGSVIQKMDPYFPFSKSVERYVRSYAALGITYAGATMNLDLLDRPKKYSNGFCHWPQPAWIKSDGTWVPSEANFTSLADPMAVGSGLTALTTLMHEAGHAAHFANIRQRSPLFSQERAPTSVAYAENQSMFLDSLVGDAAWRARYARNASDDPIPFDVIEEEIRSTHPFAVFQLRSMLAVSYFEKAMYELPEDQVTAEKLLALADEIELKIQGGLSPRPLLSIPHLISDEASCYYQGYTLAEMSVHQTRAYFKAKYGYIVDNPNVGPTLKEAYWKCGNSRPFLEIVHELTGKKLGGDAWVLELKEPVDEKIVNERLEYDAAIMDMETMKKSSKEHESVDLDMTVRFVDGDTLIADSSSHENGLLGACREFEMFVSSRMAQKKK
eukprot:scaffold41822_cov58-Attheya_sp.AAC.1